MIGYRSLQIILILTIFISFCFSLDEIDECPVCSKRFYPNLKADEHVLQHFESVKEVNGLVRYEGNCPTCRVYLMSFHGNDILDHVGNCYRRSHHSSCYSSIKPKRLEMDVLPQDLTETDTELTETNRDSIESSYNSATFNPEQLDLESSPEFIDESSDAEPQKCPVCFMIFPRKMPRLDRDMHVSEHLDDEQDEQYEQYEQDEQDEQIQATTDPTLNQGVNRSRVTDNFPPDGSETEDSLNFGGMCNLF